MTTGATSELAPFQSYITLSTPGFVPLNSPGRCEVNGATRPLKYDEQEGYGIDGGRLTLIGTKFVHFEVEISIWTAAHWIEWQLFGLMLVPPPAIIGLPSVTMGIDHPKLRDVGINKVCLEDPGEWKASDSGLWTRTLKFIKWQQPRPRFAAVKEGPPGTSVAPVPLTAQQKINAALDAENAALRTQAGP